MQNNWHGINVDIIVVIWLKQHTGCSGGIKEDLGTCITQGQRQSIRICISFDSLNSSWPGPLLHHATFSVSGGGERFSLLVVASSVYSLNLLDKCLLIISNHSSPCFPSNKTDIVQCKALPTVGVSHFDFGGCMSPVVPNLSCIQSIAWRHSGHIQWTGWNDQACFSPWIVIPNKSIVDCRQISGRGTGIGRRYWDQKLYHLMTQALQRLCLPGRPCGSWSWMTNTSCHCWCPLQRCRGAKANPRDHTVRLASGPKPPVVGEDEKVSAARRLRSHELYNMFLLGLWWCYKDMGIKMYQALLRATDRWSQLRSYP